jgi:DnaJ-class molecular chaperone
VKIHAHAHYYVVLGVTNAASDEEIKRAYRAAARSHHPDLPSNAGDQGAATRFREVNEAYEVLSDPRKRKLYDTFGKKGLTEAYKDWQPPEPRAKGPRRRREHLGTEDLGTEAGSSVASIFEDLFASAVPSEQAKKRNENLWHPGNLDMGPVSETEPLARGKAEGKGAAAGPRAPAGRAAGGAATGGGRFGPGGFSMSDLKEGLKAAAGYGGMSEGGGDASDGPMPSWVEGMMGGPVDEEAFGRDRGSAMPRFHQQGGSAGGAPPRVDKWGPTDDDEWVDGAAGPAGWEERNAPEGWIRDNNAPRREPEPPENQGPTRAQRRPTLDAEYTAPASEARDRRRKGREEPSRAGDTLHATARIPLLTAIHGGRHTVTLRMPDNSGNWGLEAVEITVPPGLEDGGTLRLGGRGHHGDGGGPRGDLVLALEIEPHPVFRLDGRDVHVVLPLTPLEAAGGARLEVPTLFGTAQVTIPPGVGSGDEVRLRGMGLPALDARSSKGDQLLTVQIRLPRRLSRKHLEWLEMIEQETGFEPRRGLWEE